MSRDHRDDGDASWVIGLAVVFMLCGGGVVIVQLLWWLVTGDAMGGA